jgi:TolA-binding protein
VAKKESKIEELLEQPENIIEDLQGGKFEEWFNQYKNIITYVGGGLFAIIFVFIGWKYYSTSQNEEAQNSMFQAVYYFESDSLNKALNGDGNNQGLIDIANDYGYTKAGNLAKFYAGTALLKQGKFEDAIEYLDGFSSDDILVQARAYSLVGDAYLELGNNEGAVKYYEKASNYKPTKEFTPDYLMKLGLANELNKDYAGAAKAYDKLITDFPNSTKANDAKKYKAMNEALAVQN